LLGKGGGKGGFGIPGVGGGGGAKGGGKFLPWVNPTTALLAFTQALTPDTGVKGLPEGSVESAGFTSGDRMTQKGLAFESTGEWNVQKAVEDAVRVANGEFFGDTFGRGYSTEQVNQDPRLRGMAAAQGRAREEYVRTYQVQINVKSVAEAEAAMAALHKNTKDGEYRDAADATGGDQ
jgi:hypothetical protein